MSDSIIPKCFNNRLSLKSATFQSLEALIYTINDAKNVGQNNVKVLILTSLGQIKADLAPFCTDKDKSFIKKNDDNPHEAGLDISYIMTIRNNHIIDLEKDSDEEFKIVDSSPVVYLKNVELTSLSAPQTALKYEQLILFADQIIGFSIINEV